MQEFILTIKKHVSLGYLTKAYFITKSNPKFFTITEQVSSELIEQKQNLLSKEQKNILSIIDSYSDNHITKIFSKGKFNPYEFVKNVDEETLKIRIRPYIEQRHAKLFEYIKKQNVQIFHKTDNYSSVHPDDEIFFSENPGRTVFNIIKEEKGTRYYLSIKHNDESVSLFEKHYIIISNSPCYIVIQNKLYFFEDIEAKVLTPFFNKKHIFIPDTVEKKWYESFASKAVKKYDVKAEGFEIIEKSSDFKTVFSLEKQLATGYGFILKFKYQNETFIYGNEKESVVEFDFENFCFTKFSRNRAKEEEIKSLVENSGFFKYEGGVFYEIKNEKPVNILNNIILFLNEKHLFFEENNIKIEQKTGLKKYYIKSVNNNIQLKENKDWFDIYGTVQFGKFIIPFLDLKENILSKNPEFILPDQSIVIIPEEWFAQYSSLFLFGKKKGNKGIILKKHHYRLLNSKSKILKMPEKSLIDELKRFSETGEFIEAEVPKDIRAELREYQKTGFKWLYTMQKNNFGACLADDMGLGKTLQTITLLQQTINELKPKENYKEDKDSFQLNLFSNVEEYKKHTTPSLVVAPVSLIHNWENEIMKFAPFLKIMRYRGTKRHDKLKKFNRYDVILTGYGIVRNDIEILKEKNFLYLILDESQNIKNPDSKTYKSVLKLNSDYKLILTGTPVENSVSDLYAQMNFINDGLLGNRTFFNENFLYPIEKMKSAKHTEILRKITAPFILRRKKEEVAKDLPPLTEQTIFCRMSESQRKFYNKEKSKIRNSILKNEKISVKSKNAVLIIKALTRLRQIANHPHLIENEDNLDSGKFDIVCEMLENIIAENHKVLVFSSFVKHLKLIEEYLTNKEYKYSLLTGATTNREAVISDFQEDEENKVFLISIKAGGTGLNLTEADYVFILDPWWNPAVEEQAVNRAHRIGQDKSVFVYKFISEKTVEEKIRILQNKKKVLAENIITAGNPLKALSEENIKELFD